MDAEPGDGVRQLRPQPHRADEQLARGGGLATGERGLRGRGEIDRRQDVLLEGLVLEERPGGGEIGLRLLSVTPLESQKRKLGMCDHARVDRPAAGCLLRGLLEDLLGRLRVALEEQRDAEQRKGSRVPDAGRREVPQGEARVGFHLRSAVAAEGRTDERGPDLGRGAAVRHRAVVLGVLEREPVALRVVRAAAKPVQERAEGGNFRVAAEERGVIELLQPALDGDDAPAPVVGQREHADQACDLVDVAGCGHVRDRGLRLAVLLVPGSRAAVQHLAELRLETIELSTERVTEEVAEAVPLTAVIERNEEEVGLLECLQPAC